MREFRVRCAFFHSELGRDNSLRQSRAGIRRPLYGRSMWAGIALAALAAAASALERPGPEAPCPSQADVDAELARVGALGIAPPEIVVAANQMRVVLRGRDGVTVGSREVEAPANCHERATVAAVLVATWMGIWPEGARPASAPNASTTPTGTVGSTDAKGSPPTPLVADKPPASSQASDKHQDEYSLALTAALDGNGLATGAVIEVRQVLAGPVRGLVGVSATTERDQSVGAGTARYTRPALEAGVALRLGHGRVQGEVSASGRLGVLIVRGKDLPVTHFATHVVPGAAASLRLVMAGKRFSPFVLAGGTYWFGREELRLDDDVSTANLPGWDLAFGIGLFWAP